MLLRWLAPAEYRLRHDILGILREKAWRHKNAPVYDADLAVGSGSIASDLGRTIDQVEAQLHVLAMRKHVAYYHGAPDPKCSHVLNEGVEAFTDKTYLKEGRDEAFKTLSVYGAWIGIVGAVAGIITSGIGYNNARDIDTRIDTLESRARRAQASQLLPTLEQHGAQDKLIRESVWATCGNCDSVPVLK